jgi:hypothetical protein
MADLTYAAPVTTVGEQFVWTLIILDVTTNLPPTDNTGVPNLALYQADLQVRQGPGTAILLEASTANGQIVMSNTAIVVTFPAASIRTQGSFQYELKLTDPNGIPSKPIGGVFLINPTTTP